MYHHLNYEYSPVELRNLATYQGTNKVPGSRTRSASAAVQMHFHGRNS